MNARTLGVGGGLGLVVMLSPDASLPGFGPQVNVRLVHDLPVLVRVFARRIAEAAPLGDPRAEVAAWTVVVLGSALLLALVVRALFLRTGAGRRVRSLARRGYGSAAIARRTGIAQDLVRDLVREMVVPEGSARKGLPVGKLLRTGRGRAPHVEFA